MVFAPFVVYVYIIMYRREFVKLSVCKLEFTFSLIYKKNKGLKALYQFPPKNFLSPLAFHG